jgi:hypothetical protein
MTAALPGDAITVTDEEKIVDTGIVPPRCKAELECRDEMFAIAVRIVREVRLRSGDEESRWAEEVNGHCHVWGDFYGPATSAHLARALAHRFLDRQGGDLQHMRDALAKYGAPGVLSPT